MQAAYTATEPRGSTAARHDPHLAIANTSRPRLLAVHHSRSRRHFIVSLPDKTPDFYVEISVYTPGKPDITLHSGPDKTGPVLGVSKFVTLSSGSKIALGDPDMHGIVWEDLKKTSFDHSKYEWQMTIYPHRDPQGERRAFAWKRTHSVGIDGSKPPWFSGLNLKLIDDQTNEILAVFTGSSSWSKRGTFQINKDYGREFDIMVLLSGMTILERAQRRSSGGGGGGDGGG
ncbi:hypothetical protein AJ80_05877 [Polytolypa hystricis UAMH7299]|uniref:Uncharacterized protein n=1 Tax=Polytolypa hystricis (strain UAMH7299) TaxID=1447883 RepID=A0A2B7Y1H2_POLH7|nr:hypothetical protein AJ80_05877 [Polytolypa hystricis UAMH7299]